MFLELLGRSCVWSSWAYLQLYAGEKVVKTNKNKNSKKQQQQQQQTKKNNNNNKQTNKNKQKTKQNINKQTKKNLKESFANNRDIRYTFPAVFRRSHPMRNNTAFSWDMVYKVVFESKIWKYRLFKGVQGCTCTDFESSCMYFHTQYFMLSELEKAYFQK